MTPAVSAALTAPSGAVSVDRTALQSTCRSGFALIANPDISGDGLPDIVCGQDEGFTVHTLDAAGIADAQIASYGAGYFSGNAADGGLDGLTSLGDVDGDGIGDVMFCANGHHACFAMRMANDGSITTQTTVAPVASLPYHSSDVLGDVDGDGVLWIVIAAGFVNRAFVVRLSTAFAVLSGTEIDFTGVTLIAQNLYGISVVNDFDGNGMPEIVIAGSSANEDSKLIYLSADGTSVINHVAAPGLASGLSPAGDVDGNGVLDLIGGDFADSAGGIQLVLFNKDGTYVVESVPDSTLGLGTTDGRYVFTQPTDFNNDGMVDIFLAAYHTPAFYHIALQLDWPQCAAQTLNSASSQFDTDLELHLTYDELSTSVVRDCTNQHNGQLELGADGSPVDSSPFATDGVLGGAFDIQGTDDVITDIASLDWTPTTYSVSYWLHPYDFATHTNFIGSITGSNGFQMHSHSSSGTYAGNGPSSAARIEIGDATGVYANDEWQFLVLTYGSNTLDLYRNGQLIATKGSVPDSQAWTDGFQVGYPTGEFRVSGKIDDVRVYSSVLSAAVVEDMYDHYVRATVTPRELTMDEDGGADDFTIALAIAPTADVTVSFSAPYTAADPVTFTSANYAIAQVVTVTSAVDAAETYPEREVTLVPTFSSDDGFYDGFVSVFANVAVFATEADILSGTILGTSTSVGSFATYGGLTVVNNPDVDGDNIADVCRSSSDTITCYNLNADGSAVTSIGAFSGSALSATPIASGLDQLAPLGDYDGNGVGDLIYCETGKKACYLAMLTDESALLDSFEIKDGVTTNFDPTGTAHLRAGAVIGDVNDDSDVDLIVASLDARLFVLFMSNAGVVSFVEIAMGSAEFSYTTADAGFGFGVRGIGDVNGDDVPDIAAGTHGGTDLVVLFLESDGSPQSHTVIPDVGGNVAGTIGDFDGNGVDDILTGAFSDSFTSIVLLNNDGTARFVQSFHAPGDFPNTSETAIGQRLAPLGDFDGNGSPDFVEGIHTTFDLLVNFVDLSFNCPGLATTGDTGPVTIAESGGLHEVSLSLDTFPSSAVTVTVDAFDTDIHTISSQSLTFTADDWDSAQTLTVTGVDTTFADDERKIDFLARASSDDFCFNRARIGPFAIFAEDGEGGLPYGTAPTPNAILDASDDEFLVLDESDNVISIQDPITNTIAENSIGSPQSFSPTALGSVGGMTVDTSGGYILLGVDEGILTPGNKETTHVLVTRVASTPSNLPTFYFSDLSVATGSELSIFVYTSKQIQVTSQNNNHVPNPALAVTLGETTIFLLRTESDGSVTTRLVSPGRDEFSKVVDTTFYDTLIPAFTQVRIGSGYSGTFGEFRTFDRPLTDVELDDTVNTLCAKYGIARVSAETAVTTVAEDVGEVLTVVFLSAPPTADVTFTPASSDADVLTASGPLTFTAANYNVAQTATSVPVDNSAIEADQTAELSFAVSSGDAGYDGAAVDPVDITVENDDEITCGDRIVSPGEECDDGNMIDGDTCSNACESAPLPTTFPDHHVYWAHFDGAGARGVELSDDFGGSYTALSPTQAEDPLSVHATGQTVYIVYPSSVEYSHDGGATWTTATTPCSSFGDAVVRTVPSGFVVMCNGEAFPAIRTDDGGATFTQLPNTGATFAAVMFKGSVVFATSGGAVSFHTDTTYTGGTSIGEGGINGACNGMVGTSGPEFAWTTTAGNIRRWNGGSYSPIAVHPNGDPVLSCAVSFEGDYVLAGLAQSSADQSNGGTRLSTDGGLTFGAVVDTGHADVEKVRVYDSGFAVACGTGAPPAFSNDFGASWWPTAPAVVPDEFSLSSVCGVADLTPICGNGFVETDEECDDGYPPVNDDGCSSTCLDECGDGVQQPGEACDDGNDVDNDACTNACTTPVCGDGIVQTGEECDDENNVDNDACTNACTTPACGDGIQQAGEACDDGNDVDNDACTNACTTPACGDGIQQTGEACDDGNDVDNDACTNACTTPACGDGIQQAGEACDDGNDVDNDGCSNTCTLPGCGDGIVQTGEECDDGGVLNNDGCSDSCKTEVCGDTIVQTGEECDDGNLDDTDGCTQLCFAATCGNGSVETGESCDDGLLQNGDGCSADCITEEGSVCSGEPSECGPWCEVNYTVEQSVAFGELMLSSGLRLKPVDPSTLACSSAANYGKIAYSSVTSGLVLCMPGGWVDLLDSEA